MRYGLITVAVGVWAPAWQTITSVSRLWCSGLAEDQPGGRVQANVVNRNPFSLDAIEATVCPEAAVATEPAIFPEIGASTIAA